MEEGQENHPKKSELRKRATRKRGEATREELLAAGFHLLRTEGAAALRVRRVADEANCSTMGVYTWFGDKDGLVEALWLDSFRRFGEALAAPSTAESALERVRELMQAYRRWALQNPVDYRLMFGGAAADYQPGPDARAQASGSFFVLAKATADAQAAGFLRDGSADEMALQIWAVAHGLIAIALGDVLPVEIDTDRVYGEAVDALLEGLMP